MRMTSTLSGRTSWMESQRFDVVAKPPQLLAIRSLPTAEDRRQAVLDKTNLTAPYDFTLKIHASRTAVRLAELGLPRDPQCRSEPFPRSGDHS